MTPFGSIPKSKSDHLLVIVMIPQKSYKHLMSIATDSKSWLLTRLHGFSTSHVVRMVKIRHPGLGSMAHVHLYFVGALQLCKLLVEVGDNLEIKHITR